MQTLKILIDTDYSFRFLDHDISSTIHTWHETKRAGVYVRSHAIHCTIAVLKFIYIVYTVLFYPQNPQFNIFIKSNIPYGHLLKQCFLLEAAFTLNITQKGYE